MKLLKGILVAGVCSLGASAFAWHEPGHMITALIAYENLSPGARNQLLEILKEHPRFDDDFKSQMPEGLSNDDQGKWLFCRASIWPDLVRRKFDGSLVPNPKVKTSYHRSHWHFINFPFVLLPTPASSADRKQLEDRAKHNLLLESAAPGDESLKMNVVQAIEFNSRVLKDTNRPKPARAVAICWLLHTVGDIH